MTRIVSAVAARSGFGQIMKRAAENNERFVVGRRGEPSVVILSVRDFVDTLAPTPKWLKAIGQEAKRKGLNHMSMREIEREIAAARRERRARTKAA